MTTRIHLERWLSSSTIELLRALGAITEAAGINLYLVGGSVRDCFLGVPVVDFDLTSDAPAQTVATIFEGSFGSRIRARSQFGTLKLALGPWTFDLATARTEIYPRPGALPKVSQGTIAQDLARRDFSVNAMALPLGTRNWGQLIDPMEGVDCLRKGLLRVLHDASFQDDATRILRAIRYSERLGLSIERHTMGWLHRDRRFLTTISPARVRKELERFGVEPSPIGTLLRAHDLGVLGAIDPALGTAETRQALQSAKGYNLQSLALWGVLTYGATPREVPRISQRLALTQRQREVVEQTQDLKAQIPSLVQRELLPHEIAGKLDHYSPMSIHAVAAAEELPRLKANLDVYLHSWRHSKPIIGGIELLGLGIKQGPEIGRLLQLLRNARLDGRLRSRKSEIAYIEDLRARGLA